MTTTPGPERPMDYTTDPPTPLTADNIRQYVTDVSRKAQAAELRGDQVMADFLHSGINQELELLDQLAGLEP